MKKLILFAALSLSLSGCVTTPTDLVPVPVASAGDCGLVFSEVSTGKALYVAEAAYNGAAHAYVTVEANGKLTPSLKAATRPKLLLSYDGLLIARQARTVANACSFNAAIDSARTLAEQVKAILPN